MSDNSSTPVAVITGSARGIGKGCALQLAKDGYAVVIADVRGEAAKETADEFSSLGYRAAHSATDVTNPADCTAMIDTAMNLFGGVDVLVNSAGISRPEPSLDVLPETWR